MNHNNGEKPELLHNPFFFIQHLRKQIYEKQKNPDIKTLIALCMNVEEYVPKYVRFHGALVNLNLWLHLILFSFSSYTALITDFFYYYYFAEDKTVAEKLEHSLWTKPVCGFCQYCIILWLSVFRSAL